MSDEEILCSADSFTASGELFALFLMTMHTFDFERLTRIVRKTRERIPQGTQIIVNIGDFDTDRTDKLHFRVSGGIRQSRITVLLSSWARAGRAGRRFRRAFFDARR
jgi:hypothetical protein